MTKPKTDTKIEVRQSRWSRYTPEQKANSRAWSRKKYNQKLRLDPVHKAKRHAYVTSERGKAVRRAAEKRRRVTKKAEVIAALGSVCNRCGFSDLRALQIDHVNGGGWSYQQRGTHGRNGNSIYPKILKNLIHFQLLCANCNWIKREENKEYGKGYRERVEATKLAIELF